MTNFKLENQTLFSFQKTVISNRNEHILLRSFFSGIFIGLNINIGLYLKIAASFPNYQINRN